MTHDPPESVVPVDPANADQMRNWDGDGGAYWADNATRYDEGVASYRRYFLAAAAISGATHPFEPGSFDVAISRTGTMFFGDAPAAFTHIARALRPDGRLVLMTWQSLARQEWLRGYVAALSAGRDLAPPPSGAPGPFAFAEPGHVRAVLSGAGFADVALTGVTGPMYVGPDATDATRCVLGQFGGMLIGLDDAARAHAVDDLHATMIAHATDGGVLSAVWMVEARRS